MNVIYNGLCDHRIRYSKITLKSHIINYIINPSYRIIFLFRLLSNLHNNTVRKILNIYYLIQTNKFSISLEPGTCISEGLIFPHNGPIVINPKAKIGCNCIIHPCVLIGGNRQDHLAPSIGDNVFIGHGSKIIGGLRIGNDVFVAPGATITKDIPPDSIVGAGINNIIRRCGGG